MRFQVHQRNPEIHAIHFVAAVTILAAIQNRAQADGLIRTIAISGEAVPGSNGLLRFDERSAISFSTINNAGDILIRGSWQYAANSSVRGSGLWLFDENTEPTFSLTSGGVLTHQMQEISVSGVWSPLLNNRGDIAFAIDSDSDGVGDSLWQRTRGQAATRIVELGEAMPGMALERTLEYLPTDVYPQYSLTMNDRGSIAFAGRMDGSGVWGLWARDVGEELRFIDEGVAPSDTGTSPFAGLIGPISSNNTGEIAYMQGLLREDSYTTSSNERGIWIAEPSGEIRLVVREAESIPGDPTLDNFASVRPLGVNSKGHVTFSGALRGAPGTVNSDSINGIWSKVGNEFHEIVRENVQAWGMSSEFVVGEIPQSLHFDGYSYNQRGDIAFRTALNSTATGTQLAIGSAIWLSRDGSTPRAIAKSGDYAAGLADNAEFVAFESMAMNDRGQVAFVATAREPIGTTIGNSGEEEIIWRSLKGLWAQDYLGENRPIAVEGDSIDIDDGPLQDLRTIKSVYAIGASIERPQVFNERGQIIFSVQFTDGSKGTFVSHSVSFMPGDYDQNGIVEARDYETWKESLGTTNPAADGNGDGVVDAADYSVWRDNLGRSALDGGAESLAVPEPGTTPIACALFGALGIVVRGRREVI